MRFLADESCDFAVAELSPRAADSQVIRLATADRMEERNSAGGWQSKPHPLPLHDA